jgi:hypothetical protein
MGKSTTKTIVNSPQISGDEDESHARAAARLDNSLFGDYESEEARSDRSEYVAK